MASINATDSVPELAGLNLFDYIRSVAVIIMFFCMTFYDRRTWLLADIIGSFLMGAFHLFYPHIYIKNYIAEDDIDNLQCYLVQVFCCNLLADAAYRFYVRKSRDHTTISSLVWGRVLTVSLMLMFGIYIRLTPKFYLRAEQFSFVLLGTVVWLVSSVVQLLRYVSPLGGVEKGGLVTWSLRFEFLVSFVFGLAHIAYPGWLLGFQVRRAQLFHRFLLRMVGILRIGLVAFQAQQAIVFRYDKDRNAFFISRILAHVLIAICLGYNFIYEDLFNKKELLASCGLFLNVLPCLLGLLVSLTGWGRGGNSNRYSGSSYSSYYTRSKTGY
ncbi:uncharacterized protein LOC135476567 [Liolophura sinensis]|uniref:uncharacterized protein LOC135476567 n=1 Tax=Liolophura sinensis TaxID=3198878 RepID=UPI0031593E2E